MLTNNNENNEAYDIDFMGSKISNLQLSMLNKKKESTDTAPTEIIMVGVGEDLNNNMKSKLRARNKLRGNDLDDTDIMAYSNAATTSGEVEESSIFSSGGAFADALAE